MRSCWIWSRWKSASCSSSYDFPGDDIPIIRGSARMALESTSKDINAPEYAPILELMDAVDSYPPRPDRQADKPFLMPVEDVFSILRSWYCCHWSCGERYSEGQRYR